MPQTILQQLGLTPNEAKIYEALLDLKQANASDISTITKVYRRNVYDTLNRLIDKGLVFPVLSKGQNLYCPVDPGKLTEFLKEKQTLLEKAMPHLKVRYEQRKNVQEAYIYRGLEGVKNYMRDVLRVSQDVYCIGTKMGILDPRLKPCADQLIKESKRKGIKYYCLFDNELKEHPDTIKKMGAEKPFLFLPKEFSTTSGIDIFGDYIVTCSGFSYKKMGEDTTIFVLRDKQLADDYRIWFKCLSKVCKKN